MILVDANLLIYATLEVAPSHREAKSWLDERLSEPGRVGLPWDSLLAFLRIVTNPRVRSPAVPMSEAWLQVQDWLRAPSAWVPLPTLDHGRVLDALLPFVGNSNHVPDMNLAALAIEHGLILQSADSGFARFPGLRSENPLRKLT